MFAVEGREEPIPLRAEELFSELKLLTYCILWDTAIVFRIRTGCGACFAKASF
jgi:hypothetical protein